MPPDTCISPGRKPFGFGHHAAPLPSTVPEPWKAMNEPVAAMHIEYDGAHAFVSLEKRRVPSVRKAKPLAWEIVSPFVKNV